MSLTDASAGELVTARPAGPTRPAPAAIPAWPARVFLATALWPPVVAILAFLRWQAEGAIVPWDSKNHFYAMFRFLGNALAHGTIPLWNPYHFAGYPTVADPQSLLFTPSMLLFALVAPNASMELFDAVVLAHLVGGAIGVLGLARHWRWHPVGALLAALVFMLGGAASSRLQHTGMIISYAWFPLALWALLAALESRSMPKAVLSGLLAALMALGRDQVAYLLCLALLGAVAREAFRAPVVLAYVRSRLPILACAGTTTLLCMVVPMLLTLQFLHLSNRPGIAFGMALEGSLDPINLLTLFSPDIFGSLDRVYDYWGPGAATAAGNDWTDRTIDYLFVGTLPIVLIAWHGLAGGRLAERGARYFALLCLACAIYALGRHTPIFSLVFDWVPGVSLYRRPADATFPMNIALALSSGYLLHRYIEDGAPRLVSRPLLGRGTARVAATAILAALLVGAGLAFARNAGHLDGSLRHLVLSSGLAAFVAIAILVVRARARRAILAGVLVTATACQLLWTNTASPMNAEPATSYSPYQGLTHDQAEGLAILRADIERRHAGGEHPRVEVLGVSGSWQNASMVLGLEDTIGYNPLRIDDYERAVGVGESSVDPTLRTFPDTFRGYNSRLAALLGLDYLVLGQPIVDLPRHIPRPRATLLYGGDHFYVYRLDGSPVPRVGVATRVLPVDSEAVIDAGSIPPFDVTSEALIDRPDVARLTDGGLQSPAPASTRAASKATIEAYGDNSVRISADAASPAVVVLHDIAYPGWTVTVDGRPAPILRVDLLFRGVEIPAGHHVVEFSFHPLSWENLIAAARGLIGRDRA